ncbi:RNA polymerase sigma-70 factor [Chitinophaga polysaccharea]|uniref:RNA polymerase sigma factor n=1 Tax=Chitinophaga TaxID=79328 RepID=UPI0014557336|nr:MULTISPECIES: RNA polymerase sigma-70 factor [Chitinophaga]NLR62453.1 RNA polymerase sigma-70 factor [Chitinophaga polysaccharea]NLU92377.1 RNA polymerase sigma-70 factor [Chitinophaga sp. Ak27]
MSEKTLHNERELLSETAKGNEVAFAALLDLYRNKLYSHALSYLKSCQEAEELVQDVFLKIWDNRHRLPEIENFKNYLFILSRNQLVSAVRKRLKSVATAGSDDLNEGWLPDRQLEWKETYQKIQQAIDRLSPQQKAVFTLSRFENFTYQQIAVQLQISPATVKFHMVAALNALREALHYNAYMLLILPGLNFFFK